MNFAAESHVDRSIISAEPFLDTNVTGTLRLLEAARARRACVGSCRSRPTRSTACSAPTGAFEENTPLSPRSPVLRQQDVLADNFVMAFRQHARHGHGDHALLEQLWAVPVPGEVDPASMILNAVEGKKALPVYGDGLYVRGLIHVEDHCEAIDAALLRGRSGEVYNVGAENERPNLDVVRAILHHTGRNESLIRYVP